VWLSDFLQKRRLDEPDGTPLYAYHCTDGEYHRLAGELKQCINSPIHGQAEKGASFCLFIAEWWRRHYAGGPWRWEDALAAAGLRDLPRNRCYELVNAGLRYWRRNLLFSGDLLFPVPPQARRHEKRGHVNGFSRHP
jgi:hypothetical protein